MTAKSDIVYIDAIIQYGADIKHYVNRYGSIDAALDDPMAYDAILRKLQILAESTQHLSDAFKNERTSVDWRAIAGFRNVLVHDYLGDIDMPTLIDVIDNHLPHLLSQLTQPNGEN